MSPHFYVVNRSRGRRPLVKWPKSCDKKLWNEVNTDLCNILEGIRGSTIKKLERMGNQIYAYGVERSTPSIPTKSRRQTEIDRLVKERRQLKKQWRKATEEEKEGINVLQEEIQSRLATLRRAENLLKKTQKEGANKITLLQRSLQICEESLHKGEERKSLCVKGCPGRTSEEVLHR